MTIIETEEEFPEELLTTDKAFQYVYPIAHQIGWNTEQIKDAINQFHSIEGSYAGSSLRGILISLSVGSMDMIQVSQNFGLNWDSDLNPVNNTFEKIIENVANTNMRSIDMFYMFDCKRYGLAFIDIVHAHRIKKSSSPHR